MCDVCHGIGVCPVCSDDLPHHTCGECQGRGVVWVDAVRGDKLTPGQRKALIDNGLQYLFDEDVCPECKGECIIFDD